MDTFDTVCDLISKRFEISRNMLNEETTLDEIGADSIDLVDLVSELEEEFEIHVPDEEFENIKTLGNLVEVLESL